MARVAERAARFPLLHAKPFHAAGLDTRDASLGRAIDQAVARHWLTLAAVAQSRLSRPWRDLEPHVQSALLVGAAQLLLLERLPDHAVINEAVTWTKGAAPRAAALVNAVLRGIARLRDRREARHSADGPSWERDELPLADGRVFRLTEAVFEEDPLRRLGQQTSHPRELLEAWVAQYGLDTARRIAAHDVVQPPIIVTGLDPAAIGAPGLLPHDEEGFTVFDGDHAELRRLLAAGGSARVQDPASAAAVAATASLAPGLIVEVCAGLGTKTRQLDAIHPRARIVATDANPAKRRALRESFARRDGIEIIEPQALSEHAGRADLVALDVPCTNTAVLARRVEARYRFGPRALRQLVELQRAIVADSVSLLADSGHLLYSTCSLEAPENEQQVEWIVRQHSLRLVRQAGRLPRGGPGDPPRAYADGGYHALFQRVRYDVGFPPTPAAR